MSLDRQMLVDDGWSVVEPFRHKTGAAPAVRISKGGARLYLNLALWQALGRPAAVKMLWDLARCRVALEPCDQAERFAYNVRAVDGSPGREVQFQSVARALGLAVERATTVPHELVGFRLIVDLRALRSKGGAA